MLLFFDAVVGGVAACFAWWLVNRGELLLGISVSSVAGGASAARGALHPLGRPSTGPPSDDYAKFKAARRRRP